MRKRELLRKKTEKKSWEQCQSQKKNRKVIVVKQSALDFLEIVQRKKVGETCKVSLTWFKIFFTNPFILVL